LLSLWLFIRYFQTWNSEGQRIYFALTWSAVLIMASLFRIEGVVFLLFLPLAAFFNFNENFTSRLNSFLQLNILLLFGSVVLITWLLIHPEQQLSRLSEIQFQLSHGIYQFIYVFQN